MSNESIKDLGKSEFERQWEKFWTEFSNGKKMVLSTSEGDRVSSRMMSVVQKDGVLYFQTDKTMRKYSQLTANDHVALCIDNIQIEGRCTELGRPREHAEFCRLYRESFPHTYERYTMLENERLFRVVPMYIERWLYVEGVPYQEIFETENKRYRLREYKGGS